MTRINFYMIQMHVLNKLIGYSENIELLSIHVSDLLKIKYFHHMYVGAINTSGNQPGVHVYWANATGNPGNAFP